jgi:hypothetical protein
MPQSRKHANEAADEKVRSFADSTTMLLASRVAMTVGIPFLMTASVWVLSSISHMQVDIGVMKSQISTGIEDRYHASDAAKDFALRDLQLNRNTGEIASLRAAVEQIERRQPSTGMRP